MAKRKRILVIDDEKDIVEIYRKALEKEGYEPICAYSGEEGLNILRANPFDLVVLDLKMPKMTGDKFLHLIRKDPLLKDTKVLVMSSVLYRYKEIPRYEPDGRYVRTDIVKEGLSKFGKRADKTTKPEEGKLEMEEKPKPRVTFDYYFGYEPENEANFERNLSEDLIRRVKGIFGEPYQEPHLREKPKTPEEEKRFETAIEEKTKDIIAKMLKIDKEKLISSSTSFPKDLGIAFIDAIPLRRRLEKEFKVKISWENQKDIETIGDLIYCIEYLKMRERTKKERFRRADREFWEFWKPYFMAVGFWLCVGLAILLWQFVIKKYFLKSP
ncbi:MAG: response regulator [Candidatus Omnitrophica bacterium]|nr:response regulator [Candidatus Omnitrophota bacterium]